MSFTNSAPVRERAPIGLAMVLAYLIELEDGTLGETTVLAEATHIEVLLPDGTVGVDVIGNYAALHTQEVAYGGEVLGLSIGDYVPVNLINNPGFESGALSPHVVGAGAGTWSIVAVGQRSGVYALQYDPAGQSATARFVLNGSLGNPALHPAFTEGDNVFGRFYVAATDAVAANTVRVRLNWRDAAAVQIGFVDGSLVAPTQAYQAVEVSGTAPANTAYAVIEIRVSNGGNANLLLFDDTNMFLDYLAAA